MRNLKIRIWDKYNGIWDSLDKVEFAIDGQVRRPGLLPENYDVQLFTGLTDRHGVEIYEGDIVEVDPEEYVGMDGNRGAVEMLMPWACWYIQTVNDGLGDVVYQHGVTVIGNIMENPELLK